MSKLLASLIYFVIVIGLAGGAVFSGLSDALAERLDWWYAFGYIESVFIMLALGFLSRIMALFVRFENEPL